MKTLRQWMLDHPDDEPCPRSPDAARAWRIERGLELTEADKAENAKYEAAMAKMRLVKPPPLV
jgi:hypothetical protein